VRLRGRVDGRSDEMRIAEEEIFGRVASVVPFDTIDAVVERSNRSDFGLGGYKGSGWGNELRPHSLDEHLNSGSARPPRVPSTSATRPRPRQSVRSFQTTFLLLASWSTRRPASGSKSSGASS
jgi:hypothetical protein